VRSGRVGEVGGFGGFGVVRGSARLREAGLLDDDELARLEAEVAGELDEAVAFAEAGPFEPVEDLTKFVYTLPED
jgi:TPP-dependent pyruvate/acetoin dehydrogenase alpha subunit